MLRVLKYYQKGYRIPLDSLSDVIARLVVGVDLDRCSHRYFDKAAGVHKTEVDQAQFSRVICGLLREVDPSIDPNHLAHLPSDTQPEEITEND